MSNTDLIGKVAGVISLAAFVPYIFTILIGKTKPNRASWWIWAVVGLMLATSYYSSGAQHTIWVPISYVIGPLITAIISIKYGEGGWTKFDRSCLIGAAASLILWMIFREPLIALSINLLIDMLGALPTILKSYHEPEGESRIAWLLFITANTINMFAVEQWTFAISAYPIYMFVASGAITALTLFRPRKQTKSLKKDGTKK